MKRIALAATLVAISATAFSQSFTVALKNGEKVTYKNADVDSIYFHDNEPQQPEIMAPRIGDYYYSDGTWSTELNNEKTPIGVVFYAAIPSGTADNEAFYKQKDGVTPLEKFHGYVLSLRDATSLEGWDETVWWSPFNADASPVCSTTTTDFLGYTNTLSIKATAEAQGGLTDKSYPACYYATTKYEAAVPSPEKSSGWFLPSVGQLDFIFNKVYFDYDNSGDACVENSLKKLGDAAQLLYRYDAEYWSSTEKVDSYGKSTWAYYYSFDERQIRPGFQADYRKNAGFAVRSILVF